MAFSGENFDRIIFCESFSHATNKIQTFTESWRVLKKGGRVIIGDCFVNSAGIDTIQYKQIKQVEEGFKLAQLATDREVLDCLENTGFDNIFTFDITKNIVPSAVRIRNNSLMRLEEGKTTLEIITVSRYGCVALCNICQ